MRFQSEDKDWGRKGPTVLKASVPLSPLKVSFWEVIEIVGMKASEEKFWPLSAMTANVPFRDPVHPFRSQPFASFQPFPFAGLAAFSRWPLSFHLKHSHTQVYLSQSMWLSHTLTPTHTHTRKHMQSLSYTYTPQAHTHTPHTHLRALYPLTLSLSLSQKHAPSLALTHRF